MELEDAARVGLPPAVDELVVVADDEEAPVRPREHVHQRELRAVEVLELVHQHVVEPLLDEGAVRGVGQHVGDGEVDLVVEGLRAGRPLGAGELGVGRREGELDERRLGEALEGDLDLVGWLEGGPDPGEGLEERADRVAAAARLELAQRDARGLHGARHEGAERAPVVVQRDARGHDLALVAVAEGVEGGAVDAGWTIGRRGAGCGAGGAGWEARGAGSGTAPAADGACVRRRPEAARARDAQRRQPLLELLGRLAVEGEHEDAGGVAAAVHELDDAADERLGLAGAGGSQHPRRPLPVLDGGALGGVQPDGVGLARGPAGAGGSVRDRGSVRERVGHGAGRDGEQAADVLEVERGGLADLCGTRGERLGSEREAQAVRQAAGEQRVDEAEQHRAGCGRELVRRAAPVPQADSRLAPEQRPARLARVVRPVAPGGEAHAGSGRRRAAREVAAALRLEEHQSRAGRRDVGCDRHGEDPPGAEGTRPAGHRR